MQRYLNLDGDSCVVAYEIGPDWIRIRFRRRPEAPCCFSHRNNGEATVEGMKELARFGRGLGRFIRSRVMPIGAG